MDGKKTIVYQDATLKVIRVEANGRYFYTQTLIYDEAGNVIKDIITFRDGEISID